MKVADTVHCTGQPNAPDMNFTAAMPITTNLSILQSAPAICPHLYFTGVSIIAVYYSRGGGESTGESNVP
jgi:hypothetical protein